MLIECYITWSGKTNIHCSNYIWKSYFCSESLQIFEQTDLKLFILLPTNQATRINCLSFILFVKYYIHKSLMHFLFLHSKPISSISFIDLTIKNGLNFFVSSLAS